LNAIIRSRAALAVGAASSRFLFHATIDRHARARGESSSTRLTCGTSDRHSAVSWRRAGAPSMRATWAAWRA
jgi:hypothetical protein